MYLSQIKKMFMIDIKYQFILNIHCMYRITNKELKHPLENNILYLYFFQNNKIKQHVTQIFFSLKTIWKKPTNFAGKITVINFCYETCSHYSFSNMGFTSESAFSLPSRVSTIFSANSKVVPGPLLVISLPSVTTRSSLYL